MERPLRWEEGYIPYNLCCSSPTQPLTDMRLARLVNIFCSLRFENPSTWRASSPYLHSEVTGWSSYTLRHWVPFSSPPTNRRCMLEIFETTLTRGGSHCPKPPIGSPWKKPDHGSHRNLRIQHCRLWLLSYLLLRKRVSRALSQYCSYITCSPFPEIRELLGAHRVEHLPPSILLKHVHIRTRDLGCWDSI
jgi:hypothetical protein